MYSRHYHPDALQVSLLGNRTGTRHRLVVVTTNIKLKLIENKWREEEVSLLLVPDQKENREEEVSLLLVPDQGENREEELILLLDLD